MTTLDDRVTALEGVDVDEKRRLDALEGDDGAARPKLADVTVGGTQWYQVFVPCAGSETALRLGVSDAGLAGVVNPRPRGISLTTNGYYFASASQLFQQLS